MGDLTLLPDGTAFLANGAGIGKSFSHVLPYGSVPCNLTSGSVMHAFVLMVRISGYACILSPEGAYLSGQKF